MPTVDIRNHVGKNREQSSRTFEHRKVIDFAEQNITAADFAEFYDVQAGAVVESVATVIRTAEGEVCTGDVGDATDPNGWVAAVDCNAAANTFVKGVGAYAANGKYYAAQTALGFTPSADANVGKVEIVIKGYMLD